MNSNKNRKLPTTVHGSQLTDHETDVPVLAIDGPSGSGKGTVSQLIAERRGWRYLDSGALYRLVSLAAQEAGIDADNAARLEPMARDIDVSFVLQPGAVADVLLEGEIVGDRLRTEDIGHLASKIAAQPRIRQALLQRQRDFRRLPGLVADGRDMGTTVFPDAVLKIYLTASLEVRAERRYKQLKGKGFDVNLARLLGEIRERDARDAARLNSPLKPADDACVVDTSDMSIIQVVEQIDSLLAQRL